MGYTNEYRKIPGVDVIYHALMQSGYTIDISREQCIEMIRKVLEEEREKVGVGFVARAISEIVAELQEQIHKETADSFCPVINGTGIILHTNLGRAPLGDKILDEMRPLLRGYNNLEFDLKAGGRGHRNDHIRRMMQQITGAEDAVAVNNNAAAVLLVFKTLAEGSEVIVSRGELIEIGGSFRIPDIMQESGAGMVEVGCTNRTRIKDYEDAITSQTKMIFKAHKSNYYIGGFSEEAELEELAALARKHNLILYYDIGSGLLTKPEALSKTNEPDVKSALQAGVDIVSFSGDKLLGGAQAGIIAGAAQYIKQIETAPLMRALRVGKLTISALIAVMKAYLQNKLREKLPVFEKLNRDIAAKKHLAEELHDRLKAQNIESCVVDSYGRCGGGTMPELKIDSFAVELSLNSSEDAEKVFYGLLSGSQPILGILREGRLLFDVMSLDEKDLPALAEAVKQVCERVL